MDMNATLQNLINHGTDFGLRLLGALAFWIIGRWLINISVGMFTKAMDRKDRDQTMIRYLANGIGVLLQIVLIVSVLGYMGVETTSFAALLAAIGVAIGAAWGGLLTNLAAGVFLVFLRPFKVGDYVLIGGMQGTVREINLFVTAIDTPDNVRTFIGNNKILSDTVQNFNTNEFRRVELVAQISGGTDPHFAIKLLKERISKIPNVLSTPAPEVSIVQFTEYGPLLAVRPFCHNDNYWQVYFETNATIRDAFGEAKFAPPEKHSAIRNVAA